MLLKLDINLFKYLVITTILYWLTSKIPSEIMLFKNKYLSIAFFIFIMILVDQTDKLLTKEPTKEPTKKPTKEGFENTVVTAVTPTDITTVLPPANIAEIKQEEVQNKITTVLNETIPKVQVETTVPVSLVDELKKNVDENKENISSSQLITQNDIINKTIQENKAETCNCEDVANKAISKFLSNRRLIDNKGMLHYADAYLGDMGYSDLRYENYIPLGSQGDGVYNSWDMGQYQLINTSRWRPIAKNEGRCRKENIPDPLPYDKGQMSLMNWDYSRKVTGPVNINTKYIDERLNQ